MAARKATRAEVKVGMTVRFGTMGGRVVTGLVTEVTGRDMIVDDYTLQRGGEFALDPVDILREPALLSAVKPGEVFEIDPALLPPVFQRLTQPFACKTRDGDDLGFIFNGSGDVGHLCLEYYGNCPVTLIRELSPHTRDTEPSAAPETEMAPAPARVARRGRVVSIDGAELGTQPSPKTQPCPPPESPACRDCGRAETRATPESGVPDPYRLQLLSTPDGPLCGDCASILLFPSKPRPKPEPSRLLRDNAGARYHMDDDVDATGVPSVG